MNTRLIEVPSEKQVIEWSSPYYSDQDQLLFIKRATSPGYTNIISGDRDSGKTFVATNLSWYTWYYFGAHVLTNKVFKRVRNGVPDQEPEWPDRVHYVDTHFGIIEKIAMVLSTYPDAPIWLDLDETQNFMSAYKWSEVQAGAMAEFLIIARKFKVGTEFATVSWNLIPAAIREWNRHVTNYHWFKSPAHVADLNAKGFNFGINEVVWVEGPPPSKSNWLKVGYTPWTLPQAKVEDGFVYDTFSPGSDLDMGIIGYTPMDEKGRQFPIQFGYHRIVKATKKTIGERLAEKLVKFVERCHECVADGIGDPDKEIIYEEPRWVNIGPGSSDFELKEAARHAVRTEAVLNLDTAPKIAARFPILDETEVSRIVSEVRSPLKKKGQWNKKTGLLRAPVQNEDDVFSADAEDSGDDPGQEDEPDNEGKPQD